MPKVISTKDACKVLGLAQTTLSAYSRNGLVPNQHVPAQGRGKQQYFSPRDLHTIAIARKLRENHLTTELCIACAHVLQSYSDDELERAYAAGKSVLVILCGSVLPFLARREDVVNNPQIAETLDHAAEAGVTTTFLAIDTAPAWRRLKVRLAEQQTDQQ